MSRLFRMSAYIILFVLPLSVFAKSRLYIHNNTDTVLELAVGQGTRKLGKKYWKFKPAIVKPYEHISVLRLNRVIGLKMRKDYIFKVKVTPTETTWIRSSVPFFIRVKIRRRVGKKKMHISWRRGTVVSKWSDSKRTRVTRWGRWSVRYRVRPGTPHPNITFMFVAPSRAILRFPIKKRSSISKVRGPYFYDMRETKGDGKKSGRRYKRARCKNHRGKGLPKCYGGHTGTDYMLKGGFRIMKKRKNYIVAARNGKVTAVQDCYFDKCRAAVCYGKNTDKDGNRKTPNYIEIDHGDGTLTRYVHIKKNSAIVGIGEYVKCGQEIARIGSSGRSVAPHLHFTVKVFSNGRWRSIDPYQGKRTRRTLWYKSGNKYFPSSQCSTNQKYRHLAKNYPLTPTRSLTKTCSKK